ncbi:MAG: hypothetical protein KAS72_01300 [Phycisphaerales bacterium]|nr:hypothetical protein [Phycisphaerales bacterium]
MQAATPSAGALRRRALGRLSLIGCLLVVIVIDLPVPGFNLLAMVGVLAAVAATAVWDRWQRTTLSGAVVRTEELTLLSRHGEAWDAAWDGLPICRSSPVGRESWTRLCLAMVRCALWAGQYELVEVLTDAVLEHLRPEHPLGAYCRLQRSIAASLDGRPGVAEDELVPIRGMVQRNGPPGARAGLLVAELAQCYASNQPQRACEHAVDLDRQLAPIGRDAGLGHLLAAWAMAHTAQRDRAQRAWRDATLLLGEGACRSILDPGLDALEQHHD